MGMIKYNKIADLLTTTYDNVQIDIVDLSQELREYIVMPYLMKKNGGMREITGGVGWAQTLMTNHGGRSRFIGEYDEDTHNVIDHLDRMRVDFCLMNDAVAYSVGELRANRGQERIHNVIEPKKRALYLRVIETMEEVFFKEPDPEDEKTPWGLKYWMTKNSQEGFFGGYPAGFTSIAGLNLSKVPQMKNYTFTFSDISKADFVFRIRRAFRRTNWKTPKPQAGFTGDQTDRRILLAGEELIEAVEEIGEAQNDNLGRDIAPYTAGRVSGIRTTPDGDILIRRHPLVYAEYLDADSSCPIYGFDRATFFAVVRKGDNMVQTPFEKAPNQSRVFHSQFYHSYQFVCIDRKNNFVGYKV